MPRSSGDRAPPIERRGFVKPVPSRGLPQFDVRHFADEDRMHLADRNGHWQRHLKSCRNLSSSA